MVQNVPAEAIKTESKQKGLLMLGLGPKVSMEVDGGRELGFLWSWYGWGAVGEGAPEDPSLLVYLKIKQTKKMLLAERNKKPLWGSVKLPLHNPENLSLNPRTLAKSQVRVVTAFVIPELWTWRRGASWDLLASQPSLISKPQVPAREYLQKN